MGEALITRRGGAGDLWSLLDSGNFNLRYETTSGKEQRAIIDNTNNSKFSYITTVGRPGNYNVFYGMHKIDWENKDVIAITYNGQNSPLYSASFNSDTRVTITFDDGIYTSYWTKWSTIIEPI